MLQEHCDAYMRMFRCSYDELNDRAKDSTESRELKSISITWILASAFCSKMLSFTFPPLSSDRQGMTTVAPLSARTLAVSFPIPLVAPANDQHANNIKHSSKDRKRSIEQNPRSTNKQGSTGDNGSELAGVDAFSDLFRGGGRVEATRGNLVSFPEQGDPVPRSHF